ncbi:rhomboid family intramembrane serine protease [Aquihabitans sp. G128]|uniref:rhomboid family intramembrane serine protease n=1 Tax=Aquihabitans sp. G128 TaxID=2849779 RepID=UPI001C213A26|nr:rhomboid family intramembrane serine protease [Aquihabitans sp. G128]QXC62572.1 rhomboid family intramembrane serine protease [Aquihabitans sp. G128]
MSGRYAFSLPDPRQRDGWFRVRSIDVTTTALIVGLGLISMLVYAADPATLFKGAFQTDLVRDGELWRLATWPLANPPLSIWVLVGLAVFWFLGHVVEDQVGRKPFTALIAAMAVIPAVLVTLLGVVNENSASVGKWSAFSYGTSLLTLGLITIFGIDNPNAKFFFGIPAWVIAAAYVAIEVLGLLGNRAYAQIVLLLLVIAVGVIGARQRGLCEVASFIPRVRALGGPPPSPYGQVGSSRPKRPKARRPGRGRSRSEGAVVAGPWNAPTGGPTPLEQAELDVLLDRISAGGIDSLTKAEKARLNDLSKRMRGS